MPTTAQVQTKQIDSEFIIRLYTELEKFGIKIWIDGGWAVDALLGEQTRTHSDFDLAIEHCNVAKFRKYSESQGFFEIERAEDKKWDFVLSDDAGHEIDVHAFTFDESGNVSEEDHWAGYEKNALTGMGFINEFPVRCVSLEHLLKTHNPAKRKLKEKDFQDLLALQKKFKLTK